GSGGLIMASDHILTPAQFPDEQLRAFAWLILLTIFVSGIALIDWHLTRHVKQARDEIWSFIHRQVLKVMWLLMAVGVLLTFATFFFGGGYMTLAAWVVLVDLGLYVHGLFPEQLLEWVGALVIAIGICMLAFRLAYSDSQWVAASTLGLGLPLLSLMLDRGRERAATVRLSQSAGWLLCVLLPPLLAHQFTELSVTEEAPLASYKQFLLQSTGKQAVMLPAGMEIPVRLNVSGNLFRGQDGVTFPLVLNEPLQIMMDEGRPTGELRPPGGTWRHWQDTLTIRIPKITPIYDAQKGAEIHGSLIIKAKQ
ncbi:MAG: hypothetical protein WA632_08105, partial [Gallionella sp.]